MHDDMGTPQPIDERTPMPLSLVFAAGAVLVTVLLAWGNLGGRVSALEGHEQDRDRRLERIESKVDQLLQERR